MLRLALSIVALFYSASSVNAETLMGPVTVVDGDTIKIDGQSIRLHGIDAPEDDQQCLLDGAPYACGDVATMALDKFLDVYSVICVGDERDRWGRLIAVCSIGDVDIGAWMVKNGLAVAFTKYSNQYLPEQQTAMAAEAGMWAGQFQAPAEWRAERRGQ